MLTDTLTRNGLEIRVENGLLAVSPKQKLSDSLREFIRLNKQQILAELRKIKLDSLLSENDALSEQFEFEVEERTAIMIFDGEVEETEANTLAFETTLEIWLSLFGE
ncbi:MAG TPA: hypothetical protein VNI60_00160 [Pyrinomonadaceae bacterium]|nr:hypothetical protein [Pyrinomonadaceae bacterium]